MPPQRLQPKADAAIAARTSEKSVAGKGLPHRSPGGVGCTWDAQGCRLGTGSGAVVSSLQPQAGSRRTVSGAEQPQRGSFDIYPVSLPFVPSNAFSFLLIKEK